MSATLQEIARKYKKSPEEVRRTLPLVGHSARNIGAVATIPDDIEQKLEAHWLSQTDAVAPQSENRPAKKRVIAGAEVVARKRRQFTRPVSPAAKKTVAKKEPAPTPPTHPSPPTPTRPAPARPVSSAPAAPAAPVAPAAPSAPVAKKKTPETASARAAKSAPAVSRARGTKIADEKKIAAAQMVDKKPDERKSEAEKLYEAQIAAQAARESAAKKSPPTPPTPPTSPTPTPPASASPAPPTPPTSPASPAPSGRAAKPKAPESRKVSPEPKSKSAGTETPAPASRPRPIPMEDIEEDEEDAGDFHQRRGGGRGTITIDEKVVRRRRRKRERQAPRSRAEAGENVHGFQMPAHPVVQTVRIPETISLQNLADQLAMKVSALNAKLRGMGAAASDPLDRDTAWLLVEELGHKAAEGRDRDLEKELLPATEEGGDMRPRPPVVTVMGHVDHGKTSLLDAFRKTRVAAGEAGGITQHIGAHQISAKSGRKVTFIDTPGHELFSEMRARGARVTDLVVLVVAADDGVKPQTAEAISHAKAAGVPMVVAANKMDKADADLERVKRELAEKDVLPEDWGGDAMVIPVSAETGEGLDNLLDAIILQSDVLELRAPTDCPGAGVVIEGRIDKGRGPVASVIVRRGILRKGDSVLCGSESGKIRAMWDDSGRAISEAGAAVPVEIQGLSGLPESGAEIRALADGRKAREVAELRGERQRAEQLAENLKPPEDILAALAAMDSAKQELRLVVKADVSGSREALVQALSKISGDAGEVKILHSGVGGVSESEVHLADSSGAWVVAFNVRPDARARKLMEQRGVRMLSGRVIYDIVESAREALVGMLEPVVEERILGTAEVLQVFPIAKVGNVAGCRVSEGVLRTGASARLLRGGKVVYRGEISSLRRFKESAQEVRTGDECGVFLRRFNDAKVGDVIEAFETVESVPQI